MNSMQTRFCAVKLITHMAWRIKVWEVWECGSVGGSLVLVC